MSFDTLWQYDSVLSSWGDSLAEDADIVLYGCDVSFGKQGNFFLQQISQTTGADVLASVDKTGINGDWELETKFGEVEADSIFTDSIATAYQYTLDEGDFGIIADPGIDFGTDVDDTGADFFEVPAEDLILLPEVDIDNDGENFSYSELESGDLAELDYQNVPAEDLEILTTEEGLSFTEFKAEDLAELDLNNIPPENIKIMADAGLDLKSYPTESVADVKLSLVENVGYVSPDIFTTTSLSPDNTFGELSATVVANANLYDYKSDSVNLNDGFSLAETEQLDFNDYKALDFAFAGDEIFDSSYYLEQNPDVASDGINPFTHYFSSGASAPEIRDPSTYFDTSFYLENNPDVAGDGINPLFQYFNSGAKAPEFRDPDPAFDTSFYLKEYTDVAESGINPLFQYFNSGAGEGRFANETFKTFEESQGAWVISPDITVEEFGSFKSAATKQFGLSKDDEGPDLLGLLWSLAVGTADTVKYVFSSQFTEDALEKADNLQQLVENVKVFVFPQGEPLDDGGNIETFDPPDVDFGTPPYDLGEPIFLEDNTFFPKDGVLDDILNGQFEFPAEDELTFALFDIAGREGNQIGDLREQAVVDLVGGTLAKDSNGQDIKVFEPGASESVKLDVLGANGELILVGGPNKVTDFGKLGGILRNLKLIADARGVEAQYYFTDDTDEAVIKFTEKRLGAENVFTFPEVTLP